MNGLKGRSEYDTSTAISTAKAAMAAKLKSAKQRLGELRSILPDQRAAFVLDEITDKELRELESEIREHQFFIEMAQETLEGLSRREMELKKSDPH